MTEPTPEDVKYRNVYQPDEKRLYLRQSAIQCFLDCRRRFHLEYVLGLEPDYPARQRPWTTATTGTAVHLGVETYYGGGDGDVEAAILGFADEYFPGWQQDQAATKGVRLAIVMVLGYIQDVQADGADIGETTLAIEHQLEVEVPVGDWTVVVSGQIDRILQDRDGMLVIEDTKTTDRVASTLQYIQQLGRYALLYRMETGQRVDRVRSNQMKRVLRNGAGPFYGRPWVPLNEDAYDSHWASMQDSLADIIRAYEEGRWYERVSKDCDWKCKVQDICLAIQHGDNHETLVELFYREKGNNT